MTEERTMTGELGYSKNVAVKPSTQLDNYLAESKGNNEQIVKYLLTLKESFTRFDNIANKLNSGAYFKNQEKNNDKKDGMDNGKLQRQGLIGELDGLVAAQKTIMNLIEVINYESDNIASFFADHI